MNEKLKGEMVHLVILEWVFDGENGLEIDAYADYNDARRRFQERIGFETDDSWVNTKEDVVIEKNGNSWTAYEDGCYTETHTSIKIESKCVY